MLQAAFAEASVLDLLAELDTALIGMVGLEFFPVLEFEVGTETPDAEACVIGNLELVRWGHISPSGTMGRIIAVVPPVEITPVVTGPVQLLEDPAGTEVGATGGDKKPLRVPDICGPVPEISIGGAVSPTAAADL